MRARPAFWGAVVRGTPAGRVRPARRSQLRRVCTALGGVWARAASSGHPGETFESSPGTPVVQCGSSRASRANGGASNSTRRSCERARPPVQCGGRRRRTHT
eukprot:252928-Prymnesium_polylepis.1